MTARDRFLARLSESLAAGKFIKLTLGHPVRPDAELRKLLLRPVLIRHEMRCSVVSRFNTRDETANVSFSEVPGLVEKRLGAEFLSANLFAESEEVQLELGEKPRLRARAVERAPATLEHDRTKSRWVATESRFLRALGVCDGAGKVRMGDKFRQIERFVDLLASAFKASELAGLAGNAQEGRTLTLCDMGAGKGYLTFAAYDFLERVAKVRAAVTGVETRGDLVSLCNKVAEECGFERLRFVQSNIEDFPLPRLDILIALHACNTATDDALAAGVRAGAEIILAAPCCHKELRPQVDEMSTNGPLRDLLRHGIFAERHAEMATDALRALLLERAGYRVRVSEFVAAEHTAKNVMLIATRRADPPGPEGLLEWDRRIAELKNFYGISQHRLERLLLG